MAQKITALKVQKRNPQRVNVYLDGAFAFGLARITAAWLQVGQELSDEKIAALKRGDSREVTLQRAVNYLGSRPRSEREMRQHLVKHGAEDELLDETVQRLKDNQLLDDGEFARQWIENRTAFRPRSRKALAYELRQRGVSPGEAEQALNQANLNEHDLALQAGRPQARKLRNQPRPDFIRKLAGFLARRGFNYETSAPVAEQLWREIGAPAGETTESEEYEE